MGEEGEKTCPLCAEEMDLTDQQLKPCKCGYEICVWCWHHIMDMAEKDDTEGRCPACRCPYNKEKIVGMAASCERLVAEVSFERKMKNQKAKVKSTEGRKQLSSVRVIQRNLVYIVGLPLNLADEDLLQRREYFGQYGKVIKVSMSRTAAGFIQQFPNNTCSVYITYSKEDDAVRCIQNVHGFVLDSRPLRACFGTTKYCHAWLRNVPCSNPDCLYLHEIGSQEDSFTKDEIISAYTRSRVQQITGAANNMQRRSGNVLPPPVDDYSNTSGKPIVKNNTNNTAAVARGSPPNGTSGRYITVPPPAAWGMCGTNCQTPAVGSVSSDGPSKQKPATVSSTLAFSSAVAGIVHVPALDNNALKRPPLNNGFDSAQPSGKNELLQSVKQHGSIGSQANTYEKPATYDGSFDPITSDQSFFPQSKYGDGGNNTSSTISVDVSRESCCSSPKEEIAGKIDDIHNLCSDVSAIVIDRNFKNEHSGLRIPGSPTSNHVLPKSSGIQGSQQQHADKSGETLNTGTLGRAAASVEGVWLPTEQTNWRLESEAQVALNTSTEVEEDIISFDNQRLKDPEVTCLSPYFSNTENLLLGSNNSRALPLRPREPYSAINFNASSLSVDKNVSDGSLIHASGIISNSYPENLVSSCSSGLNRTLDIPCLPLNEHNGQQIQRFHGEAVSPRRNASLDKGENSIISNILSMELDAWDETLTSPQNLAKLLGNTDKPSGPLKISGSWKGQSNNQSRFSFARQEESRNQAFNAHQSLNISEQLQRSHPFIQDFAERDLYVDRLGIRNGFSSNNIEELGNLGNNNSLTKLSAVSRAPVSVPPGFSMPSRPPPPGFSSHERVDQAFDSLSGNSLIEATALLRNSYQPPSTGNLASPVDIEFMDPAILAVGKGRHQGSLLNPGLDMRANYPPQLNFFDNEARLQFLMQNSLSPHQNPRLSEVGNSFSHIGDSYGLSSRLVDQSQMSNVSPISQLSLQSRNTIMSNGQWDGWNEVQGGSSMGVSELLRNDRLGYNKFYSSYDDSKYRMPSSGDLYNRNYGI